MESMSGGALVTAAALLAVQVAQGRSASQLELLALFFTCFADNLELIAEQLPQNSSGDEITAI